MAMNAKPTPLHRFFGRHPDLVQTALATKVGISQSHLSLLVSGYRRPSLPVVNRLLAVLRRYEPDLTYDDLFGKAA